MLLSPTMIVLLLVVGLPIIAGSASRFYTTGHIDA